jgi:4-aminobutyrate aminotransferase-like enzyme
MTFSLKDEIRRRQGEQYPLHQRYANASLARAQAIIGFDKIYTRGEGAYLWDVEGNRYLDLLAGFGVFNLGRAHPVIKAAMQDALALDLPKRCIKREVEVGFARTITLPSRECPGNGATPF